MPLLPLADHPGDYLVWLPVLLVLVYVAFETIRNRGRDEPEDGEGATNGDHATEGSGGDGTAGGGDGAPDGGPR